MERSNVARGVLVVGVAALIATSPVFSAAQTPSPAPENPARSQVSFFERALRGAVEAGGQQLAKQALVIAPELTLSTEEAVVRGVRLTDYGFYFDVQVPGIESTVMVWNMMARARARSQAASRTVSASGGVVDADPMTTDVPAFDPDREYSTHVRNAILDAILDSATVLNMAAGERLTVAVSEADDRRNVNPLYRTSPAKLILSIQSVDLIELRQGRITREQARQRILEDRF
jgi:hypothetical protein